MAGILDCRVEGKQKWAEGYNPEAFFYCPNCVRSYIYAAHFSGAENVTMADINPIAVLLLDRRL
ncbi:MAG: hypothetical protein HDQ98_10115 [Lachnospiraceae bacterium]|nr:hypothetical protein [Lachnospiraceae bacterium]